MSKFINFRQNVQSACRNFNSRVVGVKEYGIQVIHHNTHLPPSESDTVYYSHFIKMWSTSLNALQQGNMDEEEWEKIRTWFVHWLN